MKKLIALIVVSLTTLTPTNDYAEETVHINESIFNENIILEQKFELREPVIYEKYEQVNEYSNVKAYTDINLKAFKDACAEYPEIYDISEDAVLYAAQYDIDPFFIISVASLESGYGTSQIAVDKNNYFGLCCYDSDPYRYADRYDTPSDGVAYFCEVINSYAPNDIYNISQIYCTDAEWSYKVSNIMNSYITKYNQFV